MVLAVMFAATLSRGAEAAKTSAKADEFTKDAKTSAKADEFTKAAKNYEVTAEARVQTAEDLLALAKKYRLPPSATEAVRRDNIKKDGEEVRRDNIRKAGEHERAAADLLKAGFEAYDKAVAAWSRSSSDYKIAGQALKSLEASAGAKLAGSNATAACKSAAEAYEAAAEAFSDTDTNKLAEAAEQAAVMREILASRL